MSGAPSSDPEIRKMLELLARDLAATKAAKYRDAIPTTVQDVRDSWEWMLNGDISTLTEKVVEDVQQDLMDTFVDTTWPTCPRHPNHPLWFHDDAWHCERDREPLAPLGGLGQILPPPPPEPPFVPGPFVRRPKQS
jgi:hypothetical protein